MKAGSLNDLAAPAGETPPQLDEMVDGAGRIRPAWRGLLGAFSALGYPQLAERARRLDRAFEEESVATVRDEAGRGRSRRPSRCDPVPLILTAAEFAAMEAGLAQRARLMAAVLDDLYGPQALLASGAVPARLVYANPHFLRP